MYRLIARQYEVNKDYSYTNDHVYEVENIHQLLNLMQSIERASVRKVTFEVIPVVEDNKIIIEDMEDTEELPFV